MPRYCTRLIIIIVVLWPSDSTKCSVEFRHRTHGASRSREISARGFHHRATRSNESHLAAFELAESFLSTEKTNPDLAIWNFWDDRQIFDAAVFLQFRGISGRRILCFRGSFTPPENVFGIRQRRKRPRDSVLVLVQESSAVKQRAFHFIA